jgi:uncharacterized membrane protein YebE (DUF533 family)
MITIAWVAAIGLMVGGYLMKKQQQQQAQSPTRKIGQFWDTNKDWLIQAGIAAAVIIFAPRFVDKKNAKIVQIAAGGYAGYLVYKNWDRIQASLK